MAAARTENHIRRRSVPEFGGWDHNAPGASNYSVVFTQARADRKQQKTDLTEFKRISLGNEREFMADKYTHPQKHHHRYHNHRRHENLHRRRHHHHHNHQPSGDDSVAAKKKNILTYINCCIRP